MALTPRQRAFVENYTGNATEAAIKAGYSQETAGSIGAENLKKPEIQRAIKHREDLRLRPDIATREERLKFWTEVMRDKKVYIKERLRASELLGKAEGDFLERVEVESAHTLDIRGEVRLRLLELAKERREREQQQSDDKQD